MDVNRYIGIIVKVSFFNIKHYGQYLPKENKYIVGGGFMSRKEMINGKYAIFVPHQ